MKKFHGYGKLSRRRMRTEVTTQMSKRDWANHITAYYSPESITQL